MTITLAWWYFPLAMFLLAVVLCFAWPNDPGGHFSPSGPGIFKIGVILLLIFGAICVCIGRALS